MLKEVRRYPKGLQDSSFRLWQTWRIGGNGIELANGLLEPIVKYAVVDVYLNWWNSHSR